MPNHGISDGRLTPRLGAGPSDGTARTVNLPCFWLTVVKLLRREGPLYVRGVDMLDGTRKTLMSPSRNLAIDDDLLAQALGVGGFRTKGETVNQALREFIARRRRLGLVELFGKVDYDSSYDYKKERRAR